MLKRLFAIKMGWVSADDGEEAELMAASPADNGDENHDDGLDGDEERGVL